MGNVEDATIPSVSCHNKGLCVLLSNSSAISTTVPLTISCNKMRILMLLYICIGRHFVKECN